MEQYSSLLATIAIELLKKDVKVLIGFNQRVNVQIEKICIRSIKKQNKISYININKNIDNYLIDSEAEKCVVFADFDPADEIINLSNYCQVYWFCFERAYYRCDVSNFKGIIDMWDVINEVVH